MSYLYHDLGACYHRRVMPDSALPIAFVCGRELEYPRNLSAVDALRTLGAVQVIAPRKGRLSLNLARIALRTAFARADCAFSFVGFYGQPLVFPARLRWRRPLVLDAFVSTWDTYCFDRRIFAPGSLPGRMLFHLDRAACARADRIVVDTQAHADFFHRTFGVPRDRLRVVYVGCDDAHFHPRPLTPESDGARRVLFYGTFLPLHGVDVILDAAHRLREENVSFRIIGSGQQSAAVHAQARRLELRNVEFVDSVPYAALPEEIAASTICLGGHFGRSDKAARVIGAKSFQCMSVGRPTILGDNAANRELFAHGVHAWMVRMGDPDALADGIRTLLADAALRRTLAVTGSQRARESGGVAAVRAAFRRAVDGLTRE